MENAYSMTTALFMKTMAIDAIPYDNAANKLRYGGVVSLSMVRIYSYEEIIDTMRENSPNLNERGKEGKTV